MRPSFEFTKYKAFGWIVHRKTVLPGESFTVKFKHDTNTHSMNNVTFYTKGLLNLTYSGDLPKNCRTTIEEGEAPCVDTQYGTQIVPAGMNIVHTAVTDVEFWCFNYIINRNSLPKIETLVLKETDCITVTDRKLFLCRGTALINNVPRSGPIELDIKTTAEIEAVTKCFGIFIQSERL